ncbi:MAG: 50S ribosomal protein L15 [Candidatus Sumerlaeaceae bacterium]|jgi:large subunit ribosomal protein L15
MKIHELGKDPGRLQKRKRRGRGEASGLGKSAGHGNKGSQARSGRGKGYGGAFEGGQMPLIRRVPKRGFHNPFRVEYDVVNVSVLNCFDDNTVVDLDMLKKAGKIPTSAKRVKILGKGELTKKLTVKATAFSKGAIEKIQAAGGVAESVPSA